jgi:hypothetical protein
LNKEETKSLQDCLEHKKRRKSEEIGLNGAWAQDCGAWAQLFARFVLHSLQQN